MRIILARTADRSWYGEGGQATWGLGVEVHHYAEQSWDEVDDSYDLEPEGFGIDILLGRWAVQIYSDAGWVSVCGAEGANREYYPRFELMRGA